MARAFIELVGDYLSAHRALTETDADLAALAGTADKTAASVGTATSSMTADIGELSIKTSAAAKEEIASNERIVASLRARMAAYKEMYATASTSQQELLASSYASRSKRVSRLTGEEALGIGGAPLVGGAVVSEGESIAARDSRETSQILRGAAKGAGGLGGLGFAALAGTSFIAAYAGAAALKAVISAAAEAQATEKLLAQATHSAGASYSAWKSQIDQTNQALSDQTGFSNEQINQGLIPLVRATGNVTEALKLSALAADIARGRNIDYNTSALLLSKVVNGNVGLLKRYGVEVQTGATPLEALAAAQKKYAGAAEQYGKSSQGAFERAGAAIHNAEVQVGRIFTPVVAHLATDIANKLDHMEVSGSLNRDITETLHLLHEIKTVIGGVVSGFASLAHVVGGVVDALNSANTASHHFLDSVASFARSASGYNEINSLLGTTGPRHTRTSSEDVAAERQRAQAQEAYYRTHQSLYPGRGTGGGQLDQFKTTNLPQHIQDQLASASTRQQKLSADQAAAAATKALLDTKGALSAAARVQAEKELSRLDDQIVLLKKQQAAAVSKDAMYAKARLDYATGETAAAFTLLEQDKARLEEMLKQAKTGAARTAIEKQLTKVQTELTHIQNSSQTLGTGSKDSLLAKAKLDLANGNYIAADRLLRTDKARLEQELKQATTAEQRLAITTQLTAVEKELSSKDASFLESKKLQVAQARADAIAALTGNPSEQQLKLAEELKAQAMKAINSHKLTMQGLIDAWNAVNQANSTIASFRGQVNTYHAESAKAMIGAVAGLSHAQQIQLQEEYSQAQAHRGYAPNGPAAEGQEIHVHLHSDIDQTITKIDKKKRQRHQRAGARR